MAKADAAPRSAGNRMMPLRTIVCSLLNMEIGYVTVCICPPLCNMAMLITPMRSCQTASEPALNYPIGAVRCAPDVEKAVCASADGLHDWPCPPLSPRADGSTEIRKPARQAESFG
ncbi:hypothetical protein V5740_03430 [Croceibacterium sp. TMG7-5b_MA50]|uniref:hypothetical protein n=1 Tax=Croceibacterium sp. TMG7-5b_MA50 TaxID=3121290 RepID=UPI003221B0C6